MLALASKFEKISCSPAASAVNYQSEIAVRREVPPLPHHPGGDPGANLGNPGANQQISHRCHPILVAFVWELTEETIDLPLGCLQDGLPPLMSTLALLHLTFSELATLNPQPSTLNPRPSNPRPSNPQTLKPQTLWVVRVGGDTMGSSDHDTTYFRVGGDDEDLRPWHSIYVYSIESRLKTPKR